MDSEVQVIDTHCHIEQNEFDIDRAEVIAHAKEVGVWMITSAITPNTWERAIGVSKKFDNVEVAIGLDPMQWTLLHKTTEFIQQSHSDIIAIGEVGLDHYIIRDHTERDKQEAAFRCFIVLANELKLPIQVHSRSAGKRALEVLSEMDAQQVHLHAFDGKASLARSASRDLDYYFSIPTSVVRSPQKRKLVKAVDIERLMVETDSPVLAATKGIRNEPKNVHVAVSEVAEILRRDEEEIREIVLENTLRFYPRLR